MDSRLLEVLNEVLIEKGYDLSHPAAGPTASANSIAAKKNVYSQAAKGTSSTGRPIPETHGAAHTSAALAAAGGGAKSAGGGGMAAGLKNIEKAGVQAQLVTYGIFGIGAVTEILATVGVRYAAIRREEKKAAKNTVAPETM